MPTSLDDQGYDFLKTEYSQCVDLVKFYDERQIELLKFASGLAAAVPTLILTLRAIAGIKPETVWNFTALIAIVTAVSLLTIFAALVQNRLYFVFAARQANAIRRNLLRKTNLKDNHMYPSYDPPAFQWRSSQTMQYLFVALQAGSFFGVAYYGLCDDGSGPVTTAILIAIVASAGGFVAAILYLCWRDFQNPGQRIRRQVP
jgi:hypothetical protein